MVTESHCCFLFFKLLAGTFLKYFKDVTFSIREQPIIVFPTKQMTRMKMTKQLKPQLQASVMRKTLLCLSNTTAPMMLILPSSAKVASNKIFQLVIKPSNFTLSSWAILSYTFWIFTWYTSSDLVCKYCIHWRFHGYWTSEFYTV